MPDLPAGTVTLLFTDIEGSTRLLHELGDTYADVLAEHRRVLRDAFARHDGVEVDTQGDAFFYAFARAKDAVAAAALAQESLTDGPVRVRIGVHTGEPLVTDEGYVGVDVHRAARIMSAGHGGQVIVSETTRRLIDQRFDLRDLGPQRLKDLTEPQHLFQLGDLEFPPLKTLNQTNLPVAGSPLIGREPELAELLDLLRNGRRVVTVTGAGGSGKTRLALQAAAELVEHFDDGVFWVPLAPLSAADLVIPAVAQAVGITGDIKTQLAGRRALLLLDNFEHVVDAAGPLGELLRDAPDVRALVTSRMPLHIDGEQEYPLDPLGQRDATTLFVERARAAGRDLAADESVSEICRRLDGLPLAIELAAARTRLLAPAALLQRLDRRLPLLTGGRRDAPERQRTLRATIEWSYDLLSEGGQRLLARLAVFAGSFSLEAAENVVDADVDALAALVELNLVKPIGEDRFLLLETIREYAEERLDEAGDSDDVRRRHAEYYLRVAESTNLAHDAEGEQRHDIAALEHDNFRRALEGTISIGDAELGLAIALALDNYWVAAHPFEGIHWFELLLGSAPELTDATQARALLAYGGVVFIVGEFDRGTRLVEQSLEKYRELGDEVGAAHVLHRLANSALLEGDDARARALTEEGLEVFRRFRISKGEAISIGTMGELEWRAGRRERAVQLARESAELARAIGYPWWESHMLYRLCEWSIQLERLEDAARFARDGLTLAAQWRDRMLSVYLIALLARIAAEAGEAERAGVLWGAVEADERRGVIGQWEDEREQYAAPVLANASGEFERGRAVGRSLELHDAVEEALRGA